MGEQKGLKRALPDGYILCGGYRIGPVIGEGGFGITYSGTRLTDDSRVAIKEYFPAQYATREDGCADSGLHIFYGEKAVQFEKGLAHFNHEAEILKRYSYLEGMVTVLDTFEANHTAYIIMEFVEGITLSQYIRENGIFSYNELVQLMTPIMKSLAQIHRQGIIHRDISPENIQIGLDDHFYLLDFGAAKEVDNQNPQNTIIFKQGYAPPEQYTGGGKQGPWTDVYALAATMYTALAGEQPVDAVLRMQDDKMESECDKLVGLTDWQRKTLKKGLELKPAERYQNMETFLLDLSVMPQIEEQKTRISAEDEGYRQSTKAIRAKKWKRYSFVGWIMGVLFLAGLSGAAIHIWGGRTAATAEAGRSTNAANVTDMQEDTDQGSPENTDTGMTESGKTADTSSQEHSEAVTTGADTQEPSTTGSEDSGPQIAASDTTESTTEKYNRQTYQKATVTTETTTAVTKETTTRKVSTEKATTEKATTEKATTEKPTTEKTTTEAPTTESSKKKKKTTSDDDDIIEEHKKEDVIID